MIEFRVLGGVDLRGQDGGDLESILHQPKRLALFGYLAAASPRGFHGATLSSASSGPSSIRKHARNALTQAVHVLRRSLGSDVLVSRDGDELGLDRTRLWCDACAFEEMLAAGRPDEALELYGGDLLRGLFLLETLEFIHQSFRVTGLRNVTVSLTWNTCRVRGEHSSIFLLRSTSPQHFYCPAAPRSSSLPGGDVIASKPLRTWRGSATERFQPVARSTPAAFMRGFPL